MLYFYYAYLRLAFIRLLGHACHGSQCKCSEIKHWKWHFWLFLCWGLNIISWLLQKDTFWVRCDRQHWPQWTHFMPDTHVNRWSSDCGEENGRSKLRLLFKEYFALKGQYHWTVSWHNQHDVPLSKIISVIDWYSISVGCGHFLGKIL